jgi:hypothetical protein
MVVVIFGVIIVDVKGSIPIGKCNILTLLF